jgi:hypothetical protein
VSRILAKRAAISGELKRTSRKINKASVRISGNRHFREQEIDWVLVAKYFVVPPQILRITPGALKRGGGTQDGHAGDPIGSLELTFAGVPSLGIGFPDPSGTAASNADRVFWSCRAS